MWIGIKERICISGTRGIFFAPATEVRYKVGTDTIPGGGDISPQKKVLNWRH